MSNLRDKLLARLKELTPINRETVERVAAEELPPKQYGEFVKWLDMPGNEAHLFGVINGN